MAYVVRDMPWWKIVFAGYTVSGTANQNLLSAQHELSHFLAFKRPLYNRILSILSNCPVVVPMAVAFRKYHQEHHSHLVSVGGCHAFAFSMVACTQDQRPSIAEGFLRSTRAVHSGSQAACCTLGASLQQAQCSRDLPCGAESAAFGLTFECAALTALSVSVGRFESEGAVSSCCLFATHQPPVPPCPASAPTRRHCCPAHPSLGQYPLPDCPQRLSLAQGVDGWDVDLPTFAEANIIVDFFAKFAWTCVYIIVYGVRPLLMRPKEPGLADAINWAVVLAFDVGILYFLGIKSLMYLLLGTVFGGGLHPIAGHLIAEHYMFLKVGTCWLWSMVRCGL